MVRPDEDSLPARLELLRALGVQLEGARPVLFTAADDDVLHVSAHRAGLERFFRVNLPPHDVVVALGDKVRFAELAREHGLPVPETVVVRGDDDWGRVLDEGPFPCVVKPKHRGDAWRASGLPKVHRVDSAANLARLVPRLAAAEADYVVQEWIPGPDSNVAFQLAYYDAAGEEVVSFTGRKLRQWPPGIGYTSAAEPFASEEIATEARRLFSLVGFRGLGSVELKRDERDGRYKITEPTVGRTNLQSSVAAANGVDIVHRAYCDLAGIEPQPETPPARPVRWFKVGSDVRGLRRGGGRAFLRSYRGPRTFADVTWRDPGPLVAGIVESLRGR